MKARFFAAVILMTIDAATLAAADREWENPVFETAQDAVAAAARKAPTMGPDSPAALQFFVDLTLAEGDVGGRHSSSTITREVVESVIVTHPTAFVRNEVQRQTIERFQKEMPRQLAILEERLARFNYPELPGMAYCRLVESVDAFSNLKLASSEKMTQVGGVTYYCRYVVLPLSYVGEQNVRELRRSAGLNSSVDVEDTIRRWQRESFANLINTFRHEMVHVHTNSTLDVPAYSDRSAYPTWFHEGTATYLAADPRAGLSKGYQKFQELFFYLVQRYGVADLQRFYAAVFNGSDVRTALSDVYAISGSDQLFARSSRWHRVNDVVKTGLWIAALAIVLSAFRGTDRPYIGGLQLLIALSLGLAAATGLAEHLYGLRGPGVVLIAKSGIGLVAILFGGLGLRRIRRFRDRQAMSS